jgi:sigma-B regulation protein RsbU (phosphoserine phosphatase)
VAVPAQAGNLKMVRAFFDAVLHEVGATEPENVLLALDEACANVVKHRYGPVDDGVIRVRAEIGGDRLRLRIGRFCQRSDVPKIKPRDLGDVRPGGLGTSFIAQTMDRVEFEPEPGQPGFLALVLCRNLKGTE